MVALDEAGLAESVRADGAHAAARLVKDIAERLRPSAVILSRYAGPEHEAVLRTARATGAPIVVHLDDDLLQVPPDLAPEKARHYNRPERLAALRAVLDSADLVYASTPSLAARLRASGIRPRVVAGEIYCALDERREIAPPPTDAEGRTVVIGYMGTSGHAHDLELGLPGVAETLERFPATRFELFGTIATPAALARFGKRISRVEALGDYDAFLAKLRSLQWDIGLAPLREIPFNAAKASTKWVEYTSAGIAVVASDCAVYRPVCGGGRGEFVRGNAFGPALSALVENGARRRALVAAAQAEVAACFTLSRLEAQLLGVLRTAGATWLDGLPGVEGA
jgi:glycosyltransferase involved in cell wall biosynthesis